MASRHEAIKARLLATFAAEAQEHLQALTAHLQTLDRGLSPDETRAVVEATFRETHTLKGAARAVSLMEVEALCQEMEIVLHRITRGELGLNHSILERLQAGINGVARLLAGEATHSARECIDGVEQATAAPAEAATAPVAATSPTRRSTGGAAVSWAATG